MDLFQDVMSSLDQKIKEEEFRFWDAKRNGCSAATLQQIEERIKELKDQVKALPEIDKDNLFN